MLQFGTKYSRRASFQRKRLNISVALETVELLWTLKTFSEVDRQPLHRLPFVMNQQLDTSPRPRYAMNSVMRAADTYS